MADSPLQKKEVPAPQSPNKPSNSNHYFPATYLKITHIHALICRQLLPLLFPLYFKRLNNYTIQTNETQIF
jgi:hypothetical protein